MNELDLLLTEYEELAKKYEQYREVADNEEFELISDRIDEVLKSIIILDKRFLINALEKYHQKEAIIHLDILIEFIRAEYILCEISEANELLSLLLKISLDLIRKPQVFQNWLLMWCVGNVYDIIFHQVWWENYPDDLAIQYFELSSELLAEKFHHLYKNDKVVCHYYRCIYFIEMKGRWFATRKEEFLTLWNKFQTFSDYSLNKRWLEYYQKIKN